MGHDVGLTIFDRPVVIVPDKENAQGERRFRAIRTTSKKRNAFVVFTERDRGDGVPYQRFIRMALERALHDPK